MWANGTPVSQSAVTQSSGVSKEITVDFGFINSASSRIEVYNAGQLWSSANGHVGIVATAANWPSEISVGSRDGAGTVAFDFAAVLTITVPGSAPIPGDRIVVIAEGGAQIDLYSSYEFHFTDIEELSFYGFIPPQFVAAWGSSGSGPGQFQGARSPAASDLGYIYVPDSGNDRIQRFDVDGNFLNSWGSAGSGNGQFHDPRSVAVGPGFHVYVADTANNRVQMFDPFGVFIRAWGSHGGANGNFRVPTGIAAGPDGSVYVCDAANENVQKFSATGTFILAFDGEFNLPMAVAVGPDGSVYVADRNGIQKFDENGAFLLNWGSLGNGNGQFSGPTSIAVDADEIVLVADYGNKRVQAFTKLGTFLHKWGVPGTGNGEFQGTAGVTVAPDNNIVVTDAVTNRVQKFDLAFQTTSDAPESPPGESSATLAAHAGVDGSVAFWFSLPTKSKVRLTLHDLSGRLVGTLVDKLVDSGSHSVEWTGETTGARSLPSGIYFGRLETERGVITTKTVIVH